jgi:hypothetical protein
MASLAGSAACFPDDARFHVMPTDCISLMQEWAKAHAVDELEIKQ